MEAITDYLLNQTWQIAILFAAVAIVCLAIRKKSAHLRYLLWLLIIAKCLLPSLVTVSLAILPEKPQPAALAEPVAIPEFVPPPEPVILSPGAPAKDLIPPAALPDRQPSITTQIAQIPPKTWFSLTWLGGLSLFLIIVVIKAARFNHRLRVQRKPVTAAMQKEIDELLDRFDIHVKSRIWLLDGIGQPFVWGLLRGAIFLPANFGQIGSREHRRGILMHEIAHVLRFDAAANFLQVIAQAIFWFHPLVWWANRNIRAEREKCCDETAIARLSAAPRVYSSAIVDTLIAEYQSTQPVPSLAIAGPIKNIEDRIKTIMKPGKKFYNRPTIIAIVTILLLAIAAVPTTIALTHRQREKPEEFLGKDTEKASSEFIKTLPSGVTVELLGVCETPSAGKQWWRPDGSRLDMKIITEDKSNYTSEYPGYEMAFKVSGQDFSVSFKDIKGSKLRSGLDVLKPEGLRATRVHIKPNINKTKMKVGVAAGKWETVGTHTGRGTTVEVIKRFLSRKKIIFSGATETKEGVVMTVSDDLRWGIDTALFAVDETGAEHKGYTQTSLFVNNMQQQTFVFGDVLLEDIKEFQFRTRPYEWTKFKNVSLKPNLKTNVQIEVEKSDVQVEGEGNRYNLMARGGKGQVQAIDPNAANLIRRYLRALEKSDWKTALSMCSISVMDKAQQYPTPESFFNTVVPVKEILNKLRNPRIGYWQTPPKYFAYIFDVRISQPDLPRDVFWVWEARKLEGIANWEIDFPAIPFETWLAKEKQEIIRAAQEKEQLIKELAPRLKGVRTLLTAKREEFVVGEPMYFRLQLINQGDSILSYDCQQVSVNNSMTIKGPDGKEVKYTAQYVQTQGVPVLFKPGETKTLFDQFDITKQYDIRQPGQYRVQFNGHGLDINTGKEDTSDMSDPTSFQYYPGVLPSNVVAITIHSGIKKETLDIGKDGVEGEKAVSQTDTEDTPDVQVEGEGEKNETVQRKAFTESVLINALERGNSLVIAKILSVRANNETKTGKFYFYKTKVIEPIIIGDLRESDIKEPVELFAGSSFGDALTPGSTYALFIAKGAPYHLSWGFRNDVIKLDGFNDENLQTLVEATTELYKKTSIREFREAKLTEPAPYQILPEMPAIEMLCELFRTNPQNRAEVAKKIYESDMGSRRDLSEPLSSIMKYLPPKIILSREEIASLLGEPTLKCGWTYKWFCDPDKNNPEHVGILSITFDQLAETSLVLYDKNDRVKWKQAEVKEPDVQVEVENSLATEDTESTEDNKKPNVQVEGELTWGQAVEGLRCRLRAEKQAWKVDETPILKADVENLGNREFLIYQTEQLYELNVDGLWYDQREISAISSLNANFPPGRRYNDIQFTLDGRWYKKNGDEQLKLSPGGLLFFHTPTNC
jgi:beta-lactamase regulating signal transducer with metallopeptidase domain